MADPDLQMGGKGGGRPKKKVVSALRASFSSKHKGGTGPPGPSPGSAIAEERDQSFLKLQPRV